jgi:antitoxin component YwqK of YwqJK toxin-antitoxin module
MIIDDEDADFNEDGMRTYRGIFFTGSVVEKLEDGTIVSEIAYKDGIRDGTTRSFYYSGAKQTEGNYHLGVPVGTHRTWYENGKLQSEMEFDDLGQVQSRKHWPNQE